MIGKWEYRVLSTYPINLSNVLNDLGNEKWELINAHYYSDSDGMVEVELIFKRFSQLHVSLSNTEKIEGTWE